MLKIILLFILYCSVPVAPVFAHDTDSDRIALTADQEILLSRYKHIRIGVRTDIPPYAFLDSRHNAIGLFAEYIQQVQEYLPLSVEFVNMGSRPLSHSAFYDENLDFMICLQEEGAQFDGRRLTNPFLTIPLAVLSLKAEGSAYTDLVSYEGRRVGTRRHSREERWLNSDHPGIKQIETESLERGMALLKGGFIDGLAGPFGSLVWYARQERSLRFDSPVSTPYELKVCMIARKDNVLLVPILNSVIADMDKRKDELAYNKWIALEQEKDLRWQDYYKRSGVLIFTLFLISFVSIIWVMRLLAADMKRRKMTTTLAESEKLLLKTGDLAQLGGWEIEPKTGRMNCTEIMGLILERPRTHYGSVDDFVKIFQENERVLLLEKFKSVLQEGVSFELTLKYKTVFNSVKWLKISCLSKGKEKNRKAVFGTLQDVTAITEMHQRIEKSERKFSSIFSSSPLGICMIDQADKRVLDMNESFLNLLEYDGKDLIGRRIKELGIIEDNDRIRLNKRLELKRETVGEEIRIFTKDREMVTVSLSMGVITLDESPVIIAIAEDTREKKKMELELLEMNAKLEKMALFDGLTGIYNRRSFDKRLREEWKRSRRHNTCLSLILFDIDHFKSFNDTYGHQKGDDCLKCVASLAQNHLKRAGDFFARYGGEEFIALLPETELESAAFIADQIRKAINSSGIVNENSSVCDKLTISCGVSVSTCAGDVADLIRKADEALYRAKKEGRDRVMAAEAELRAALEVS